MAKRKSTEEIRAKRREYSRKWRGKNKERYRELQRQWREKNKERYRECLRQWREKIRIISSNTEKRIKKR